MRGSSALPRAHSTSCVHASLCRGGVPGLKGVNTGGSFGGREGSKALYTQACCCLWKPSACAERCATCCPQVRKKVWGGGVATAFSNFSC